MFYSKQSFYDDINMYFIRLFGMDLKMEVWDRHQNLIHD